MKVIFSEVRPNLVKYCERMKETFWPDWDEYITHGNTKLENMYRSDTINSDTVKSNTASSRKDNSKFHSIRGSLQIFARFFSG